MEAKFEALIAGFLTNNIGISEDFLSIPLAHALRQNLLQLNENNLMTRAGIGNDTIKDTTQKVRSDTTCWLEPDTKNQAELEFMDIIAQFMGHLNSTCYTGLNAYEFHYALYEKGTFYGRHKDRFITSNARKYSMINYLNEDWLPADGGQLIIHQHNTEQNISPDNQKSVFFQSDVLEHEVALANKARMSVTGWLKSV